MTRSSFVHPQTLTMYTSKKQHQNCHPEMQRLRKAHSPRPLPRGLSIQRPSCACCDNCCLSAWPRLASHLAPFSQNTLLVRVVCSRHKGPKKSVNHKQTKLSSALLCTAADGEANAHVLSVLTLQLQNNRRACMTDLAFSPPSIGLRTTGDKRGLRIIKAVCGCRQGERAKRHTSYDIT